MLPAGWTRDIPLLVALALAGIALGIYAGAPGYGFALGTLAYLLISYRRTARLHAWLYEEPARREPPVHGGMLGDVGDRMRYLLVRQQRDIEDLGGALGRLKDSYSALKDGIVILDADNTIEWCNLSARRMLGLRYPEDIGQLLVNLVRHPDLVSYLESGAFERDFEFSLSGPRPLVLLVQAAAFGESSKVLFVRDVSALKRLETMRQDFVANISHELRTPLTVIAGYVDTLSDMLPEGMPAVSKALGQMRQQATRMENLLKDLLLLSQLESSDEADASAEEPIAVAAMLESIRENALAASGGERRISLECPRSVRVLANRLQLESIFSNLVFNAVKYTAPGGSIGIDFQVGPREAVFSVSDDGIGIDPAHIPRLTERFYRVDKSRSVERGGTGLGLAIVKHALKRLDGELEIRSRPDAGSVFLCHLPLARVSGT